MQRDDAGARRKGETGIRGQTTEVSSQRSRLMISRVLVVSTKVSLLEFFRALVVQCNNTLLISFHRGYNLSVDLLSLKT